jgi:hypothetical protein
MATETDIEIDQGTVAPLGRDVEPRPAVAERSSGAGIDPRAERAPSRSPGPTPGPSPEPGASEGEGGYSLDPTAPPGPAGEKHVDLGIGSGDWSRWVDPTARVEAPPAPRPPSTAPPASSTGGLAEALEAHDREVGLGPSGPVISAAHEAGHSDVAPAIGTATFSITVMRTGGIQVDLVGASSNVEAWRKVADKMAAAIKRKPPRIAEGRNGVRFGLELVALERWPNGAVARSEGPALALSGLSFKSTEKSVADLTKDNQAVTPAPGTEQRPLALKGDLPPGVWVKGRGKVCNYAVGLTPLGPMLGGGCDPSNIGAKSQRVVSAKVTDQTML